MISNLLETSDLAAKLKKGSLGLFPTDTVPALCACPKYAKKIWTIKKRPLSKPLILMGGCFEDLFSFVKPCAFEDGWKMAENYWPGALTIILPTLGKFSGFLNCNSNSLGLRVPALKSARELLLESGPLATTSANISGDLPVNDELEASIRFPEIPILAPVPWPKSSGIASTVIEWNDGKWNLLRAGSIEVSEI